MACVALYEWIHDLNYNKHAGADGFSQDLSGQFVDLEISVLLFYGKYDRTFHAKIPELMKNEFKNSTFVMTENSSHNPFKEEPNLFFAALKKYILVLDNEK